MKEFCKSWMDKCNPDLILRFWRYKGRPGMLTLNICGVYIRYTNTLFGELMTIIPKSFHDNLV